MSLQEFKQKVEGKPYSFNSPIYLNKEDVVRIWDRGGFAEVETADGRTRLLWNSPAEVSGWSGVPVECDGEPYKAEEAEEAPEEAEEAEEPEEGDSTGGGTLLL